MKVLRSIGSMENTFSEKKDISFFPFFLSPLNWETKKTRRTSCISRKVWFRAIVLAGKSALVVVPQCELNKHELNQILRVLFARWHCLETMISVVFHTAKHNCVRHRKTHTSDEKWSGTERDPQERISCLMQETDCDIRFKQRRFYLMSFPPLDFDCIWKDERHPAIAYSSVFPFPHV